MERTGEAEGSCGSPGGEREACGCGVHCAASTGPCGTYLCELEAQPGGPEGRSDTTAGSEPIAILELPRGERPFGLAKTSSCDHRVPGPVRWSRQEGRGGCQAPLASRRTGSGRDHTWYDAWDRLVRYLRPGSPVAVEYEYDALGRLLSRVEREVGSGTEVGRRTYYHDASGRRAWRDDAGTIGADRVYVRSLGSGRPWFLLGSAYYYIADPSGRPVGLAGEDGRAARRFWYDGTGEPILDYPDWSLNDLWEGGAFYERETRALLQPLGAWASTVLGEELGGGPETGASGESEGEYSEGDPYELEDGKTWPKPSEEACCVAPWPSFCREGELVGTGGRSAGETYVPEEEKALYRKRPDPQPPLGLQGRSAPKEKPPARPNPYHWYKTHRCGQLTVPCPDYDAYYWLVQVNVPASPCKLEWTHDSCSIRQEFTITAANDAFLKWVSKEMGPTYKVGDVVHEKPVTFQKCLDDKTASMIDAPGGFVEVTRKRIIGMLALLNFRTIFESSGGDCPFKRCTVHWTFQQWNWALNKGRAVDWNYMTCERFGGATFVKRNPKPEAPVVGEFGAEKPSPKAPKG